MLRSIKAVFLFSGALMAGTWLGATAYAPRAHADEVRSADAAPMRSASEMQVPNDPKRKQAGEPCKSSDECQRHHTCAKVDGKDVCKAPPPRRLPPGAVT